MSYYAVGWQQLVLVCSNLRKSWRGWPDLESQMTSSLKNRILLPLWMRPKRLVDLYLWYQLFDANC